MTRERHSYRAPEYTARARAVACARAVYSDVARCFGPHLSPFIFFAFLSSAFIYSMYHTWLLFHFFGVFAFLSIETASCTSAHRHPQSWYLKVKSGNSVLAKQECLGLVPTSDRQTSPIPRNIWEFSLKRGVEFNRNFDPKLRPL